VVAGLAAWLSWLGWEALTRYRPAHHLGGPVRAGRPAVTRLRGDGLLIKQVRPAQRRALLAGGHLLDVVYMLAHALLVPLIVLLGAGFANGLARLALWLVLPRFSAIPGWCFVAVAVLAMRFPSPISDRPVLVIMVDTEQIRS
jgi:hypothetical protein